MANAPKPVPIRLEIVRRRANITQAELAAAVGCTQATISNLERGMTKDPSPELLRQIVVALRKLGARFKFSRGAFLLDPWSG